ncbi:MAG: SEC-C metal-binding domain-containing protein [Phaeodactylibacter xiamenensis]|uniref:Preprotein translocase subunit SecA n=1 Tax=Phaeodactylibacter xiamenensis TaxID=1524460 RepID=A0A098S7D2_9BACT|nr:SEC-C metal-binding domain-containing protein [Phaeodactylibacter xiamenensis]KGE87002.1 hypothetical protein IX84_18410 [Phaeodactylibacter xiamenensis]MCR9053187.1 SEC-C metal-binding domain-containing protein [bacterium]
MPGYKTRFTYDHPLIPYAVEHDAMEDASVTEEEAELMNALYPEVLAGNRNAIKPLEELVRRCPHLPRAQNHLYTLYMMRGKRRKAGRLLRELRKNHPNYLFGITNESNLLVQEKKDTAAARHLMGERLLLQDLYPERKVFHVSEVMNYYQSAVLLLLEEGDIEGAEERHGILLEIDPEHPITEGVTEYILGKKVMVNMQRMKEAQRNKRKAKTRATAPYPQVKEAPVFNHPEIEAFYRYDLEALPKANISAIAALPKTTLVQDLKWVLEDGLRRYKYFERQSRKWEVWQEDQVSFMPHAFHFLGIYGDEDCLPVVLDVLRQEEDFLDFWFGEEAESFIFPCLFRIASGQLPRLQQFMQERYVSPYSKMMVSATVAQIAWHNMERLAEVSAWFGSIFEHYKLNIDDKALIDSDLIAWMTASAGELSLKELLPVIEPLYQEGAVSKDVVGKWAEIIELFDTPRDEADLNPLPKNISEAYDGSYYERKKFRQPSQKDKMELEKMAQDPYTRKMMEILMQSGGMVPEKEPADKPLSPPVQSPSKSKTKIGRNEPCPCQSGRKYKHCCGKK